MDKKIVSDVVKALISITGTARASVSNALGKKPQGLNDQLARGSFSGTDLAVIAAACGVRLAFVDNRNNVLVTFPSPVEEDQDEEQTTK